MVDPLSAREKCVDQFKQERFTLRAWTMESSQPVALTPEYSWIPLLYFTGIFLSSPFLVNLSHGYFTFQQVSIPLLDRHPDWV